MALDVVSDSADGAVRAMGGVGDKMGGREMNQMLPGIGSVAGYPVASLAVGLTAIVIVVGMVVM